MWTEFPLAPMEGPRGLSHQPAQVWSRQEAGWWDLKAVSSPPSDMESDSVSHCHIGDLGEEDLSTHCTHPVAFL